MGEEQRRTSEWGHLIDFPQELGGGNTDAPVSTGDKEPPAFMTTSEGQNLEKPRRRDQGDPSSVGRATTRPVFVLVGNELCLDFANTVHKRRTDHPGNLFNAYSDLVLWSGQAGILTDREGRELELAAKSRPEDGAHVLHRAIALRETIYRVFSGISGHRLVQDTNLAALNEAALQAHVNYRIVRTTQGFAWDWVKAADPLGWMLWPVARSAADLLTSAKLTAVKQCAAERCGWLFIDLSHSQNRRWCTMWACGNRAKARHFYHRKQRLL